MVELTQKEKEELKGICMNSGALGAFSGMVFNAVRELENKSVKITDEDVQLLVKEALNVRVITRGMNDE